MLEVNEGACVPQMSGHVLAHEILRIGYYWYNMENDCFRHVRKCHLCQIYGDKIHQLQVPLHNMTIP